MMSYDLTSTGEDESIEGRVGGAHHVASSLDVVAFNAGRVFNHVAFDSRQAFTLYASGMSEEAQRSFKSALSVLDELYACASLVDATTSGLANAVAQARIQLSSVFGSREHDEFVLQLEERMDAMGEEQSASYWRRATNEFRVASVLEKLHSQLCQGLCCNHRVLFQLGEFLDQGIRPFDVVERMFVRAKIKSEQGSFLANVVREPGDIAPASGWFSTLRSYLVGRFHDCLESVEEPASSEEATQLVESVDRRLRERLAAEHESAASSESKLPERPRVDLKTLQVYLGKMVFQLKKLQHAIYVRAVEEAKGDWIGPGEIRKKYPDFGNGRPDRIGPKLPVEIDQLIERDAAKGSRMPLKMA